MGDRGIDQRGVVRADAAGSPMNRLLHGHKPLRSL